MQAWASYENPHNKDSWWKAAFAAGYWVGNTNDDNGSTTEPIWARTDEMAYDGDFSMRYKFDVSADIKLQGSDFSKPSGIAAAKYRISYMVYLESGNTLKKFKNVLQAPFLEIEWDIENLPRGEWVEIYQDLDFPAVGSGKRFDLKVEPGANSGVSGEQIMYFDNLSFIELVPRM